MTVHLVKLCVGATSIEDLARWQAGRVAEQQQAGHTPRIVHSTSQTPKRRDALLEGGSLYWVIKGVIQVRQRIREVADGHRADGTACCELVLDPELIAVSPVPRRAFQGWRYLEVADAPGDLDASAAVAFAAMPAEMRRELVALGLL